MQYKKTTAILLAVLAAAFYAVNVPVSKLLLKEISPTFLASLLYFGAGIGIGLLYCINPKSHRGEKKLTRKDLPYTLGMILLDIAAPILLMLGLKSASSANASLLGNFEIAATTLIALLLFREKVSKRLWAAILLITLSSGILSFEDMSSLHFSRGSLLVLAAAACWGLENNCTRNISDKSTFEIVFLKGIFSGLGSFLIALCIGEPFPELHTAAAALLLGFVAYGLSIFCYVRSQNTLGAAKTSAYYAIAPFIGTALSCIIWHDALTVQYFLALAVMLLGSVLVVLDTLQTEHTHSHTHTFTHTHDGVTHTLIPLPTATRTFTACTGKVTSTATPCTRCCVHTIHCSTGNTCSSFSRSSQNTSPYSPRAIPRNSTIPCGVSRKVGQNHSGREAAVNENPAANTGFPISFPNRNRRFAVFTAIRRRLQFPNTLLV